ncbi:PTS sugar transporter subunit IIB [Clostridiales bacterium TF09-2AC]|uniref:PTS sugar transporter subunit IIB n=1 Tax=Enterocloster hominis (ex Hitch et al. 2024) TaxID=1917870 RepID=A0ABV1D355_9FIRM|nr:lichenan-specific phosphotransferase enzyme IIB component [Clostridiales bacterium 1_7_47FAA]RJW49040.1 PTS sugar transporter subunit IIB [Clostridiales bacterium TF09-2AC]
MLTIRLFCNQGMSTSLLVTKMRQAADKQGMEVDIAAFPANEMAERIEGIDCALLGPQVGYLKGKASKICETKNVPMDVIPMADYGMCNGEKVLAFAKKLSGK